MLSTNRSLAYSAVVIAALSLGSCASSQDTAQGAAALQAAAQHRLVYFDVGKSALTPEALQVIAQAIADADGGASFTVGAAMDRSHSKLSGRRTEVVRAALIAGGVAPDRIVDAQPTSESPTPGIRDPRGRAVEISVD